VLHGTEATISRTDFSQNEKRCSPFGKTFSKVRTAGFLADGMQFRRIQDRLHFFKILKRRKPFLQPGRFFQRLFLVLSFSFSENSKFQIANISKTPNSNGRNNSVHPHPHPPPSRGGGDTHENYKYWCWNLSVIWCLEFGASFQIAISYLLPALLTLFSPNLS